MFVAKCEVIETLLSGARQTRSSKTQFFWYGLASKKKLNTITGCTKYPNSQGMWCRAVLSCAYLKEKETLA